MRQTTLLFSENTNQDVPSGHYDESKICEFETAELNSSCEVIPNFKFEGPNVDVGQEEIIQWWDGTVINVDTEGGCFEAVMHDLQGIESVMEFFLDDLSEDDISNLSVNGSIVFSISKLLNTYGQLEHKTYLTVSEPYIVTQDHLEQLNSHKSTKNKSVFET